MSERAVEAGDPVPPFAVTCDDGETLTHETIRGRPWVIWFYPKDDTPGCTREARDFSGLAEAFRRLGVDLLGISMDPPERHRRFREKHGLAVRLATDADGRVHRAFGAWGSKNRYGRVVEGVIRSTFLIGADGRILRVWRNVRVPGHAERVLAEAERRLGRQEAAS